MKILADHEGVTCCLNCVACHVDRANEDNETYDIKSFAETLEQEENRRMKLLLISVIFAQAFAGTEQINSNTAEWYSDIAGTYYGTLFSSGLYFSVVTTFFFEDDVLHGEYVMREEGTLTPGAFSEITFGEDYLVTCMWTDKHGSGPVYFVFTENCIGFSGFWSSSCDPASYTWTGRKEEVETQQMISY